jgi:addiction module HigA family antidote
MLMLSEIAAVIRGLGRPRPSLASWTATMNAEAMTRIETYRLPVVSSNSLALGPTHLAHAKILAQKAKEKRISRRFSIRLIIDPYHPGRYVQRYIIRPGISVTEAAKALGVSRSHLSTFLNGHVSPTGEMAIRIEKASCGTQWRS